MSDNTEFRKELEERTKQINEQIESYLPEEKGHQKTIFEAMNYSVKAGGKRLRPLFMQEICRLFTGEVQPVVVPFMAAIEMIHTSSLVHDDLPCMDDDMMRRGQASTWAEYGEDMGVLAGDALMIYAFEVAAKAFKEVSDADDLKRVGRAIEILASKTFDNGTVCASEQSVICEECNRDQVIAEFKKQGGYFMTAEETAKVCNLLFKNGGHSMSAKFVGRSAQVIATAAGISIPDGTRVLIGEQQGVGDGYPLSYEKLTTVLAFYTVRDWHEACELSIKLLQNGIGHTMNIHTNDPQIVREFSRKPASRILVNTGGTQGGTGASTALAPAFTLGCGTWGGSATSENVTPMNLVNIKKVVYGLKDVTTLAQSDPTFRPDFGCCRGSNAAGAQPSPMQFSGSCNCTTGNQGLPAQDGIDGKQLLELVNELVNAMKGGN